MKGEPYEMSINKIGEQKWKIRWREGGRHLSQVVHGPRELARKIERKRLSARDENRHLDIKKEVRFRMAALIDRYEEQYAAKKNSYSREKSILGGIRRSFGRSFVHEIDVRAVERWYHDLTAVRGLSAGTALRHFNVLHHLLSRASSVWATETGLNRNPADDIEVVRPNDQRDRFLSRDEMIIFKRELDRAAFGLSPSRGVKSWAHYRMRLVTLTALTTGMRESEVFALERADLDYSRRIIAVRSKLKGGKTRYVPMPEELAREFRRFPAVLGEKRIFPPKSGARSGRQRADRSFKTVLKQAGIDGFRFHDLRHTFASWYMMNGGDLYELAKILGHSNIKMTERYAKLGKDHIARTGDTAQLMWQMMETNSEAEEHAAV